jgi:hypothetical protein
LKRHLLTTLELSFTIVVFFIIQATVRVGLTKTLTKEKLFGAGISIISTGHYVIVPNVTIPKLVKIPNINRNPAIPPTKLGEGEVLSSYPDLT